MIYSWGDLISLEYGKPVKDKAKTDGKYPVYGTNGQIGTSDLPPLCGHASFILGRKGAYRGVIFSDTPFSVIDTAFYAENLHPEILDIKWAYYKFLTYDINSMDSGSAIPSTDRYEIYSIEVDLPSIHEQKRMVKLLECFDNKIAINSRINDNLQQQASSVYLDWCSQCEDTVQIGEIVDNILDYTPSASQEVVLVNSSEVTKGHFDHHNFSENVNLKGHFKKRFKKYDILYSEIRPKNKHYAFVLFDADKYIASTRLMVIRAKEQLITPSLLYQ